MGTVVRLPAILLFLVLTCPLRADTAPILEVFTLPGCHDCEEFQDSLKDGLLPALQDLGIRPEVRVFDILDPAGYERLAAETARLGWEYQGVPLLRAGNRFFYGNDLAAPDLARAVSDALAEERTEGGGMPDIPGLNLWVVLGAGFVDGVNPCALATLLFMISALALGGRRKAAVASIGGSFVLGVFAAYFLMGLGLLKAGAVISSLPWLRTALRVLTALGLWILGFLSLRDWRAVRGGRAGDLALRLPDSTIRRMHALIRKGAPLWLSGFGAAGLGVLVSISEFVCTGQVYLPTLVYIAQSGKTGALGLLAAYNLAFILPLAAVFLLVILGYSHARLTELFRGNLAAVKLGLGIFFLSFGALMLVGVFS